MRQISTKALSGSCKRSCSDIYYFVTFISHEQNSFRLFGIGQKNSHLIISVIMKIFRNFKEIIDFAIESEMDEIQFYSELAETMERKNVKQLFRSIALEKTARMLQLENMKEIGVLLDIENVQDLKIAGTFSEIDYTKTNLSYQEALIMAMNKEKEKFILYQELADCTHDTKCKQTFLSLANQEARQKLKLEIEYDEFILYDN